MKSVTSQSSLDPRRPRAAWPTVLRIPQVSEFREQPHLWARWSATLGTTWGLYRIFLNLATHCSMQFFQLLKTRPGQSSSGNPSCNGGEPLVQALRMWAEKVRTEIRGHGPGLRGAQGQTTAQKELLRCISKTEGMVPADYEMQAVGP